MNKFIRCSISWLLPFLLIVSLLLLFFVILVVLSLSLNGDFCLTSDLDCSFNTWIKHCMNVLYPFKSLISILLILLPIVVALSVFYENLKVQECQALSDLRTLLNSDNNMEVHTALKKDRSNMPFGINLNKEKEDKKNKEEEVLYSKIDNYLGTIELINVYLKKGIISEKEFNNQFGYRIDSIKCNPKMMQYINEEHPIVWSNLHEIIKLRNMSN